MEAIMVIAFVVALIAGVVVIAGLSGSVERRFDTRIAAVFNVVLDLLFVLFACLWFFGID